MPGDPPLRLVSNPPEPTFEGVATLLRARLAEDRLETPPLPRLALHVLRLANDPTTPAATVAEVVRRDPAVAERIVAAANRVPHAPVGRRLTDLQEAVARIGFPETRKVVLAAALAPVMCRGPRPSVLRGMWRDALRTAAAAEQVARTAGGDADRAFLAGLVHDAGRPVLHRLLVRIGKETFGARLPDPLFQDLLRAFRVPATSRVLVAWTLPAEVVEASVRAVALPDASPRTSLEAALRVGRVLVALDAAGQRGEALAAALWPRPAARFLHLELAALEAVSASVAAAWRILEE